ncbi:MAG: hypothetical protein R2783_02320 [Gelidibacter sp.]
MKKLALFFTAVFLVGTTVSAKTTNAFEASSSVTDFNRGYGSSFIFTEGGIEFSVFPDGQFDFYAPDYGPDVNVSINTPNVSFSLNSGYDYSPYVQYDDFGAIIQIENTPIYYDYYGRVTQVGNVNISYNDYGRVARVGGLYVHYNSYRTFTHCTGYINYYNRVYVYRPWHVYYAVPAPSFCIVYSRPYRQYYTPVRYHYYRPYTNNYRQPVRYTYHNNGRNADGRRGTVAATGRASDRYRQEATPSRSNTTIGRSNSRSTEGTNLRSSNRSDRNTRAASATRANGGERASSDNRVSRSNTSMRATQREGNTRATTQRAIPQNEGLHTTQRREAARNTSSVSNRSERVNNLPKRKPNASNTRISNTRQQHNTAQRSNSGNAKKQPSSRSASRRGN